MGCRFEEKNWRRYPGTRVSLQAWRLARMAEGLATGGYDPRGQLRLWDVKTGKLVRTFRGIGSQVNSVAFGPDSRMLAAGTQGNAVGIWDAVTGEHLRTISGHTSLVKSVVFGRDGNVLASGGWDGTVRLWNLNTGTLEHVLEVPGATVESIAIRPDGGVVAVANFQ